jgi:hypothetical protein
MTEIFVARLSEDKLHEELALELELQAPIGFQGEPLTPQIWQHPASKESRVIAAALSNAYGPEYATVEFVQKVKTEGVSDDQLRQFDAMRSRYERLVASDQVDELGYPKVSHE